MKVTISIGHEPTLTRVYELDYDEIMNKDWAVEFDSMHDSISSLKN